MNNCFNNFKSKKILEYQKVRTSFYLVELFFCLISDFIKFFSKVFDYKFKNVTLIDAINSIRLELHQQNKFTL